MEQYVKFVKARLTSHFTSVNCRLLSVENSALPTLRRAWLIWGLRVETSAEQVIPKSRLLGLKANSSILSSPDLNCIFRLLPRQMPVVAVVGATAYNTAKGQLVRAILFPKQAALDFEKKMYYFVVNLLLYLLAAIIATIIIQRNTVRSGFGNASQGTAPMH